MNPTEIAGLFARNLNTLEHNLEGLEPEDFLIRIGEDGTHLNRWIGHTLLSRQNLLVALNPNLRPENLDTIKPPTSAARNPRTPKPFRARTCSKRSVPANQS